MTLTRFLAGLFAALCLLTAANAATLLPPGKQTFNDANGAPLAGGKVYFYIPGTTTPKSTYQNSTQTTLNSNPVTLDAAGRAVIYGSGVYRQIVKDAAGNLIWDQLTSDTSAAGSISWGGTSGGSANAQAVTATGFSSADGQVVAFVAGYTNSGPLTVNVNGSGAVNVVNDLPTGSASLVGGEVVAGNVVQLVYSTTGGVFHTQIPRASASVLTGTILEWAGNTAPSGYLLAYGQCVSRTTYVSLFAVIGTTYGTCDGSTTFGIPDKRGRVSAGKDNMGGSASGRLSAYAAQGATLGGSTGEERHTMTTGELVGHTHTGTTDSSGAHTHTETALAPSGVTASGPGAANIPGGSSSVTGSAGAHTHTFTTDSTGTATPFNVMQPTLFTNFIIKT